MYLPRAGERDRFDEVRRRQRLGLRAEKLRPGRGRPVPAGSIPASSRIAQTVDAATFTPGRPQLAVGRVAEIEAMNGEPTWQMRFTQPRIFSATVAPADRAAGLVTVVDRDGPHLHAWHTRTGETFPVSTPSANLYLNAWLSHDGRYAYVLADQQGNELGHLFAVDLRHGRAPVNLTPDLHPYTVRGVSTAHTGTEVVMVAVDWEGYHLYRLTRPDVAFPAPRLLASYSDEAGNCLLTADGAITTVDTVTRQGGVRRGTVRAVSTADGESVGHYDDGGDTSVQAHLSSPLPGDQTVALVSDGSGWRRPVLWQIGRDARRVLALADVPGDIVPVDWSDDARRLLLCQSYRAATGMLCYDLDTDQYELLDLPAGTCYDEMTLRCHFGAGTYFGPDGSVLAAVESLATPLTVYRCQAGKPAEVVLAVGQPLPGRAARSVDVRSSDGTVVQGWLATPDGSGPFPTVISLHGGPHVVARDIYEPAAQMWVDHGYAYLGLNYRGSTTFGKRFQEAVWGDVGHWETEDIVAARRWLVEEGIGADGQMLLTGASYGGFLTLYAMSVYPQLWAGGIVEVGLADWALAYQDANPAIRSAISNWLGGTPEQVPQRYRERSPLTLLQDLAAPVLIRQGRHDSRTPARQMEAYAQRAVQLGKAVQVRWDDGGHAALDDQLAYQQQVLTFAAECVRPQRNRGGAVR